MINLKRFNKILSYKENDFFDFSGIQMTFMFCFLFFMTSITTNFIHSPFNILVCLFSTSFLLSFSFNFKKISALAFKFSSEKILFFSFLFYTSMTSTLLYIIVWFFLMVILNGLNYQLEDFLNIIYLFNLLLAISAYIIATSKFFTLHKVAVKTHRTNRFEKIEDKIDKTKKLILSDIDSLDDLEFYRSVAKEDKANFVIEELDSIEASFYEKNGVKTKKEYLIKDRQENNNTLPLENN